MNGRYSVVDNVTGEIIPIDIRVLGTKGDFERGKFFKMMDTFTESLLMDKELVGKSIKLLFWILRQLNFGETTFILRREYVLEDLEIGERTYYNWKKTLEKKGIIKKITGDLYTLNPECVMYGNVKKREKVENVLETAKTAKILKGVKNERNKRT